MKQNIVSKVVVEKSWLMPVVFIGFILLRFIIAIPGFYIDSSNESYMKLLDFAVESLLFPIGNAFLFILNVFLLIYYRKVIPNLDGKVGLMAIAVGLFIVSFLILSFWASFNDYRYDHFADNLTIPDGLKTEEPLYDTLEKGQIESIKLSCRDTLILYSDGQQYSADIWFSPKEESGKVCIEAIEVTTGTELSDLKEKTLTPIAATTESNRMICQYINSFSIYEGNFGQYYAAEIKAWFIPDNPENEPYVIASKIYKVQGWQR
jgi:hypothetical protein